MRVESCLLAEKRIEKGEKTKAKVITGIMATLLLVSTAFYAIPISRALGDPIKIGVIGPMLWPQGQGVYEGATLAAMEINDQGGVYADGEYHLIDLPLITGNTGPGGAEPTYDDGVNAMTDVIGAGAQFVIGGFRSEAVFGARYVAANLGVPYTITGAATNELIDCGGKYDPDGPVGPTPPGYCGDCVRCNRLGLGGADPDDRYKYTFRVTPTNSTTLLLALASYFQSALLGPWLYMSQRGGVYLDNDKSLAVSVGDFRLTAVTVGTTTYPAYTPVLPGHLDIGDPLVPIPGPPGTLARTYGTYEGIKISPYKALYKDLDDSGTVSAGDLRLTPILIPGSYPGGYYPPVYVAATDLDAVYALPLSQFLQCRFACVVEVGVWADVIWQYFTISFIYPQLMGPYASLVYSIRASPAETDFTSVILPAIAASNSRLIVHIFSAEAGRAFMIQSAAANIPAVPVGIDVKGQLNDHWDATGGACEGEAFLASTGTRTPMTAAGADGWGRYGNIGTVAFWDAYVDEWGIVPIYTSWGAYDALIGLAETLEKTGTLDKDAWAAESENLERTGLLTTFKFTAYHDVYATQLGSTWGSTKYTRPHIVQWQAGRMEIIFPVDQPYSKLTWLPPVMYPWRADVDLSGVVNIDDAMWIRGTFACEPGDPDWQRACDVVIDEVIDIYDALKVRKYYGKTVPYTL